MRDVFAGYRRFCLCLLTVLFLPAVGGAQRQPAAADAAEALASVPADYRLDVGDQIHVRVLRHPDIGSQITIPPDGMVRLPRLREPVPARGKTATELADALADGWSHVLRLRPGAVTVTIASQRMRRVYVRGTGIKTSGDFDLKPRWRISELVAVAGGTTVPSERLEVLITNERRPEPVKVNLYEALTVPGSPENVPLLEGDTVTVEIHRTVRLFVQGEGPRGVYEVDDRYGLRLALTEAKYSITGATGSLRDARLIRKAVEGDPASADEIIPVDLNQVMTGEGKDITLRDMDLLYIPPTNRQVYVFGTVGTQGKHNMREDRETHLADVLGSAVLINGQSSIGKINILRVVDGKETAIPVDFGRYLRSRDPKHNPEILPQDIIYVPSIKRTDIGQIWQGVGLWQLFRSFLAGGL